MNERYVSNQAVNNAVELRKHTLILFFDEPHISLQFKAVSALEWLQDDFVFIAVRNPSELLKKDYFITKMPAVRGALASMKDDEDVEPDQVKQFQYGGKVDFDDILFNLKTLTGKQPDWERKQKALRENRLNPIKKSAIKKRNKKNKKQSKNEDL